MPRPIERLTETQKPDARPGWYYVSIVDGSQFGLLAGPYCEHALALGAVEKVTRIAHKVNPTQAAFAGFGTCRLPHDFPNPPDGKLNRLMEAEADALYPARSQERRV